MANNSNIVKTDTELIQFFIDGLSNFMTMNQAKNTAEYYENNVMSNLNNLGTQNGVYITPQDIPSAAGEELVKQSVNAHLAKVQSEQISEKTSAIVTSLEQEAKQKYIGKKVVITKNNSKSNVFDAVLFDSRTGEYRTSNFTSNSVKGTIEEISITNNLIVIKPTYLMRKLVPNRMLFYVYVLDLHDLSPNIKLS